MMKAVFGIALVMAAACGSQQQQMSFQYSESQKSSAGKLCQLLNDFYGEPTAEKPFTMYTIPTKEPIVTVLPDGKKEAWNRLPGSYSHVMSVKCDASHGTALVLEKSTVKSSKSVDGSTLTYDERSYVGKTVYVVDTSGHIKATFVDLNVDGSEKPNTATAEGIVELSDKAISIVSRKNDLETGTKTCEDTTTKEPIPCIFDIIMKTEKKDGVLRESAGGRYALIGQDGKPLPYTEVPYATNSSSNPDEAK